MHAHLHMHTTHTNKHTLHTCAHNTHTHELQTHEHISSTHQNKVPARANQIDVGRNVCKGILCMDKHHQTIIDLEGLHHQKQHIPTPTILRVMTGVCGWVLGEMGPRRAICHLCGQRNLCESHARAWLWTRYAHLWSIYREPRIGLVWLS